MVKKKSKSKGVPGAAMLRKPRPTINDKTRFMFIGKGKVVHVVNTKAIDLKRGTNGGSQCMSVRKAQVAGNIKPRNKDKGLSPEAALALDGCSSCYTHEMARTLLPDTTKADRRAARDEVLDRAKPSKKVKGKVKGKDSSPKDEKSPKRAPTKTKAGTRSVGGSSKDKAEDLAVFMREHGWKVKVDTPTKQPDGSTLVNPNRATVEAKQAGAVILCHFIDGKYDVENQASITVGSWTGTLRGAHSVRRQADSSLDDRDRPHPKPGVGRSGPRRKAAEDEVPEDESPEDARRRVPFLLDDDDAVVLDAVMGKVIRWRNGVSKSVDEALVPAEVGTNKRPNVSVLTHPKTGRRILDFFEVAEIGERGPVFGPERVVALDKILRVVDG
jgi:hypothetical protein